MMASWKFFFEFSGFINIPLSGSREQPYPIDLPSHSLVILFQTVSNPLLSIVHIDVLDN